MNPAPRILVVSPSDLVPLFAAEELAALGFTAFLLTSPVDPAQLGALAARAEESGLALLGTIPPEEAGDLGRLTRDLEAGMRGFLIAAAHRLSHGQWQAMIEAGRRSDPDCLFIADLLGAPATEALALRGTGVDYVFDSVRWWDGAAPWFLDQQAMTRAFVGTIGFPELPGAAATDAPENPYRRRLLLAAALSSGLLINAATLDRPEWRDLAAAVNRLKRTMPALAEEGRLLRMSEAGAAVTAILRESLAGDDAIFVLINTGPALETVDIDYWLGCMPGEGRDFREITPGSADALLVPSPLTLVGWDVRIFRARPADRRIVPGEALPALTGVPRIVIEHVAPELDGGRHPVKRVVGDRLEVAADIFRDGHDKISAALWLQQSGTAEWRVTPMRYWDNDRWIGAARLDHLGQARFAIAGWTDHFASWRSQTVKKREVGAVIDLDLIEGRQQVAAAAKRGSGEERQRLSAILAHIDSATETEAKARFLLSHRVAHAMARVPDRDDLVFQNPPGTVTVDRAAARFSAWYGMFPRSQGTVPNRSATFADCINRLPEISALGFDVVYLVPIHPIGTINRKGRNNRVTAEPGDPGSPYAIGNARGGHTAIDPELGTLDDFRAFARAVRAHGMELALDFAIHCAPDHPWVGEHPGWFKRRPDGSIKFAENPPKKYEDIVNLDFDQPDWPALWQALADVIRFWVAEGVKIFRVDNPHTKPVAFWQWLIAEIQHADPEVLFLAEAFTKPKMMRHLAKIGFSQSYTYFTWRNTKHELTQYMTELTEGEQIEYFRPIFFPTTPDILPWFLQQSGRAGFRIRLILAATLSPAYGIYNGFELCEAEAIEGREEYLNSEKYQYKVWDWQRAGHIKDDIAAINRLRRASPALHRLDNLRFHEAGHGDVLFYSKIVPDRSDAVLVAVTLEPHQIVRVEIVFPLAELGLPPDAEFTTIDAFTGEARRWSGARHWIVLDPASVPALVLHFRPEALQ
ncbi:MAG: alpha-1,4-glucan--maltose-1-phosphate maltosyltransferase [Aliidongia sp.]